MVQYVSCTSINIGDNEDSCTEFPCGIRAIVEELPDDDNGLTAILLDSGADASVFSLSLMEAGIPANDKNTKLCDAQGRQIPIEGNRLVEIRLPTSSGRSILLKERVAISTRVSQPILCFGHLLEQGFGIDGVEQALTHSSGAINIPLQLQNKSMTVMGHVRVLQQMPEPVLPQVIRMVRAEVRQELIDSTIGWSMNSSGCVIGRHLSDSFQDPPLAFPMLQGPQRRTTLVKGDDGFWYILELCESLHGLIQPDAKFHEMDGNRSVITIVTEGEKPPALMGFHFEGEGPEQLAVEDEPGDAMFYFSR